MVVEVEVLLGLRMFEIWVLVVSVEGRLVC